MKNEFGPMLTMYQKLYSNINTINPTGRSSHHQSAGVKGYRKEPAILTSEASRPACWTMPTTLPAPCWADLTAGNWIASQPGRSHPAHFRPGGGGSYLENRGHPGRPARGT